MPDEGARRLLGRAATLLRLPGSADRPPEVLADGTGLRCPVTGRLHPYRDGILDLLEHEPMLTSLPHFFATSSGAWLYDHSRTILLRLFRLPRFEEEVASLQEVLRVQTGDIVLDLACGPGNFTIELAERAGPEGLVFGLDLSRAMLRRAAAAVQRRRLDNVLLIRGDALRLPLATGGLEKVLCMGGFHLFPDLSQALREIGRVSTPGARLHAATFAEGPGERRAGLKRRVMFQFAKNFVPVEWLGEQLAAVGYVEYRWALPGDWFGYISARKAADPRST